MRFGFHLIPPMSRLEARNSSRRLVSGTVSIFLAEALLLPTGFITAIFLARTLGPADYGRFALVSRVIIWLEWLSVAGFTGSTITYISQAAEWKPVGSTVVRIYASVGLLGSVALWGIAPLLGHLLHDPAIVPFFRLFAIELPLFCLAQAHRNILEGLGRFHARAEIGAAQWIGRLAFIILFVTLGWGVHGAILGTICSVALMFITARGFVQPPVFAPSTFPAKKLWGMAAPLFLAALSQRVFRLDLLMIQALGGTPEQTGYYGAAMNLTFPISLVSIALSPTLIATLSRLRHEGANEKIRAIGKATLRVICWMLPFVALLAGISSELMALIYGADFRQAGPILALLGFAVSGLVIINIAKAVCIAFEKPAWTFYLSGPMVPIGFIGHLVLTARFGGVGAALVTAAVAWMGAGAAMVTLDRIWHVRAPLFTVLRSIGFAGIVYAIAITWPVSGWWLLLKLAANGLLILLLFWATGELRAHEIAFIRSFLKKPRFSS